MADDCKTNEACDEQAPILGTTGTIVYDGTEFTCEDDAELALLSSDKLNAVLLLLFQKVCGVQGDVQDIISTGGDGFIQNISLDQNTNIITFTGLGGAYSGQIDLSYLEGQDTNDIDFIGSVTFNAGVLTFIGTGNAFSGSIDLNSINTDDVSYTQNVFLSGSELNFTGIGLNFNGSVDLQPIIDAAISGGSGSGGGLEGPDGSFYVGVNGPNNLSLDTANNSGSTGSFETDGRDVVLANPEQYGAKIIFSDEDSPFYDNGFNYLLSTYTAPQNFTNMEINVDLRITVDNQITASDSWNSVIVMLIKESGGVLTVIDYMGGVQSNADNFLQTVNPIEPLNFALNGITIPSLLTGDKLYLKATWIFFNANSFIDDLPALRATNGDLFANLI